ncbi:MAG: serine/threonine-protein kinase, partial [Gemmatimonadaceae bacterium]
MPTDLHAEARRLFDELIELGSTGRAARLRDLGPDSALTDEVSSLLAAAARAGDFLRLLDPADVRAPDGGMVAGRYRIERHLGSGAMGDVHLAWDQQLERSVALKFLRAAAVAADTSAVARFRVEARAAARLEHPHVATVYDAGETDDRQLFIAMAYYPGETLRERIARAPLAAGDALRIGAQVASALAAAHAAGIVHRDVKPANVLYDGARAKLADFGLAKATDGLTFSLTATGALGGTPLFCAPEQILDFKHVGPETDLYAAAATAFWVLTARSPLPG